MEKRFFLITTHGYTASKWLAWALNQHPDIYCNHSAGSDVLNRDYTCDELKEIVEEKMFRRDSEPVDKFLERLAERGGDARVVGNVHRYSLTSLRRNTLQFKNLIPFTPVNLKRKTEGWLLSGTSQLLKICDMGITCKMDQLSGHYKKHLSLYTSFDLPNSPDWATLAFCYLCSILPKINRESNWNDIPQYYMEKYVKKASVLRNLLKDIGLSNSDIGRAWLDNIIKSPPLNKHNKHISKIKQEWLPILSYWNICQNRRSLLTPFKR